MNDLQELFLDELADIYYAEKQIVKALPKMIKKANAGDLQDALEGHLQETDIQISRLEDVFEAFGKTAKGKKCEAMNGIISEGEDVISDYKGHSSLDAAIICAAQKVEHYEIASYGTLCTWAKLMRNDQALRLLKQNLQEEKTADKKLTAIAQSHSNTEAASSETEHGMGLLRQTRMRVRALRSR